MEDNVILLVLIPICTAIISSYLTYYFTVRTKKNEAILKFKEEKYSNLLILLQGFVGATISGATKKNFFEEQYKSWLYCSDSVVKAINEMVNLVVNSPDHTGEEGSKAVGNIVVEMRKDLLGKTNLTFEDFQYTSVYEEPKYKVNKHGRKKS